MRIRKSLKILWMSVIAGSILALAAAGTASAAGTLTVVSGKTTFNAGSGDTNDVEYWYDGNYNYIQDVNPVTASGSCTQVDTYTARCYWGYPIVINLGNQNDGASTTDGFALQPTVNGGDGDDTLTGPPGTAGKLNGDAGSDTIYAGNGNDTLTGGTGADTIHGGSGNDSIDGGTGADAFFPGNGTDSLTYATRTANLWVEPSGYSGESGEGDIIYAEDSFETYTLGSGDDQFYGAWSNVGATVNGGGGGDILHGTNFADTLNGGNGSDTIRGFVGNDTIRGDLGADDMRGDGNYDTVSYSGNYGPVNITVDNSANDGSTTYDTNATDNVHTDFEAVIGSNLGDTITAQVGAPTDIDSGYGDDTLFMFDGSADSATCGSGNDTVNSDLVDTVNADCETNNAS